MTRIDYNKPFLSFSYFPWNLSSFQFAPLHCFAVFRQRQKHKVGNSLVFRFRFVIPNSKTTTIWKTSTSGGSNISKRSLFTSDSPHKLCPAFPTWGTQYFPTTTILVVVSCRDQGIWWPPSWLWRGTLSPWRRSSQGGKNVLLSTRRFPDIFTCKLLKCKIIFYLQ